jgi:hypothetical protein
MKPKLRRVAFWDHAERYPVGPHEGWLHLKYGRMGHYFGTGRNPISLCGKYQVPGLPKVGNYGGDRCRACLDRLALSQAGKSNG